MFKIMKSAAAAALSAAMLLAVAACGTSDAATDGRARHPTPPPATT